MTTPSEWYHQASIDKKWQPLNSTGGQYSNRMRGLSWLWGDSPVRGGWVPRSAVLKGFKRKDKGGGPALGKKRRVLLASKLPGQRGNSPGPGRVGDNRSSIEKLGKTTILGRLDRGMARAKHQTKGKT